LKESDLYPPLKEFLESQNYEVKGEVLNCDVTALRGEEEPLIIELKLSLNLEVILQAVDRLAYSSIVYIGVPESCRVLKKKRKHLLKLMRMLGMGLLAIAPERRTAKVNVLLEPAEYRPRKIKHKKERLLAEFANRKGDPNLGGSDTRQGRMTAYRQRTLALVEYLQEHGATKASVLAKELEEPKARNILYDNFYGWFDREGKGIYKLSEKGRQETPAWLKF
jgi:hypothetical protein